MTDLVPVQGKGASLTIFGQMTPAETVAHATAIANALSPVIEKQNMYSMIQGKKHPKVEAWLTLGAILGILPREKSVIELPDGSYMAEVELVSTSTGHVVAGASSICGIEEKRWSNAERYARRSMAVTRATSKAYRLAFSWIIQLAGYQPTPAEEMPEDMEYPEHRQPTPSVQREKASPIAARRQQTEEKKPVLFNCEDTAHQQIVASILKKEKVDEVLWEAIGKKLHGRPLTDFPLAKQEVFNDHS